MSPMVSLLDLPCDLLDLIVSHTVSWPTHIGYYLGSANRTRELLSSPTFRTCRLLRERSFAGLTTTCIWVKVVALTPAAAENLRYLAYDLPVPGHSWLVSLNTNIRPHVLVKISDLPTPQDNDGGAGTHSKLKHETTGVVNEQHHGQETAGEDDATHRACHRRNNENDELMETSEASSIMFPYEYESFLRFCVTILTIEPSIRYFTARSRPASNVVQRILDTELAPIIFCTSDLFPFKLSAEDQNGESGRSSLDIRRRRSFLHTTCAIIEQALDLKEAGGSGNAELFLLYFGIPLRRIGAGYLTSIHHWIADIVDSQDGSPDTREKVVVRNQSLTVLHYLECETCHTFVKLAKSRGCAWFMGNYTILSDRGERWLKEPPWQWFGLSDPEMATLHLARATLLWHTGSLMPPYQWRSGNGSLSTTDDQIEAMQNMYIALHLDQERCRSAPDLLEHARHYIAEWLPLVVQDFTVATFKDAAGYWHQWVGTKIMFDGWGSFATLFWLPLAQWSRQHIRAMH